ncbi:MAG: molybdenum cofactor guanylyltransferase [Parasphingorhabdus sp.]|uniref:molybdenum cofactor guanylyltransferase n=1 Tax=Parasphingorhabdus sp. TaxID=2709688 RepID=UPI00300191F3
MNNNPPACLIILAGGQSRRMGQEKATIKLGGQRLIDRAIERYKPLVDQIWLSAQSDFDTGLGIIADNPNAASGPVGAIFTIAAQLPKLCPEAKAFITIPVDAPFAPDNLISRLTAVPGCAVAQSPKRLHPVFGYWRCDTINDIRETHQQGKKSPSLHWLVRQCGAQLITWHDERAFTNLNTPEDLAAAEPLI